MLESILLLDLDGKCTRSVVTELRAEHLYCRRLPGDTPWEELEPQEPAGMILAGGCSGETPEIPALSGILEKGLPVLAIGDTALTLCEALGGSLCECIPGSGTLQVRFSGDGSLLRDVQDGGRDMPVIRPVAPPAASTPLALCSEGILGFRSEVKPAFGFVFQMETNDPDGLQILINFARNVCGCSKWWSENVFIERAVEEIREAVGDGEAICALSGGVDSAVCAKLAQLAIGNRLHSVFVDTGFMRKGEPERVKHFFEEEVGLPVTCLDAADRFTLALRGVSSPAMKERVVSDMLRATVREEAAKYPNVRCVIRGTNCADIMSSDRDEHTGREFSVLMPVRELFKSEIRSVARALELPEDTCIRQPFPVCGLALRVLAPVSDDQLAILRTADDILCSEIEALGLQRRLWQYYATIVRSPFPGDRGDMITLRVVQASGGRGMAARLPADLLERVTERILAEVPGVRRVLYDQTPSQSYLRGSLF